VLLGYLLEIDDSLNIYTNRKYDRIVKYSPDGKELHTIGRRGEGPGDLRSLGCMAFNPKDSLLYVAEHRNGNKWISIFSPKDGTFVKKCPCKLDRDLWPDITKIGFDHLGNVYVQAEDTLTMETREEVKFIEEKVIIKFDQHGNKVKEIFRMKLEKRILLQGKIQVGIPFRNNVSWTIHGDHIYVREDHNAHITVLKLDGTPFKKLPLPFKQTPLTEEDIEAWGKSFSQTGMYKAIVSATKIDIEQLKDKIQFPKYKPVCKGPIFIGPNNGLYCRKAPKKRGDNPNIWVVTSIDTGKSKIYTFPPKHNLRAIKNNLFYFSVLNEDDEPTLTILDKEQLPKQKI
jgi:hypothetical protein